MECGNRLLFTEKQIPRLLFRMELLNKRLEESHEVFFLLDLHHAVQHKQNRILKSDTVLLPIL